MKQEKKILNSSNLDIDQLCNLIDESTFGLKSFSSTKFHYVPSYQIKTFHSSRLKRLNSPSIIKSNENLTDQSLLNRFRSLSVCNVPQSHRTFRTNSILPSINEEEINSSTTQNQCRIVDTANSCNVEELAAYLDDFLYLPKSLSGAAELMYT